MSKNPKCGGCYCYWIPDEIDIKTSGEVYKLCKKCRQYKKTKKEYNRLNADKLTEYKKNTIN